MKCVLSDQVFNICTTHAHTTEEEEILGLLLGDIIEDDEGGEATAMVWAASVQIRSDRRKDRVEISPEQLIQTATYAEQLGEKMKKRTRVVGWYHSHPHITVHPSHIDVRTQHDYQNMDRNFIGLIFSVFGKSPHHATRTRMTAFQSVDTLSAKESATLTKEEAEAAEHSGQRYTEKKIPVITTKEMSDLSLTFEQATIAHQYSLSSLCDLYRLLIQEETDAYLSYTYNIEPRTYFSYSTGLPSSPSSSSSASTSSSSSSSSSSSTLFPIRPIVTAPNPLTAMHNASVYNTVLCKLLEFGCLPLVEALGQRQVHETQRRDMLRAQIADLKKQIEQKRRQEKSKAEKGQGKRKTQTVGREEQLEEQGSDEKGGGRKNKKAKIEHR